jgi:hypothetical protein
VPALSSTRRLRGRALALLPALLLAASAGARAAPVESGAAGGGIDSGFTGAFADGGTFRSPAGVGALADVGARSLGLRDLAGGRWLVAWDAFLAARGGYVGNTRPGARLLGVRLLADLEGGARLVPGAAFSPYAGVEGRVDVQSLGAVLASRKPANEMDGVTGLNTGARLRLDAGLSWLEGGRSALAVAFVQVARHPTSSLGSSDVFTEGGLGLRLDLARSALATIEASSGRAALHRDRALQLTDETRHREVAASLWLHPAGGPWLGVGASASRDTDRLTYTATGRTFATADSPTLGLTFSVGVPLWRTPG